MWKWFKKFVAYWREIAKEAAELRAEYYSSEQFIWDQIANGD